VADSNTPSITLQKSASIRPRPATFTWTYHAQAAIWIASMLWLAEGNHSRLLAQVHNDRPVAVGAGHLDGWA
jgi:hypothetical protein